jgi:hypothetical protein
VRYVQYDQLGDTPNIVVDGYGTDSTVLTLSHWPGSATPDELKDDLSTQIAFRYLDGKQETTATAVSNNHFDEDGLCGIYAVLNPEDALQRRKQLVDVASAGDFGVFNDRNSARIAFALMSFAEYDASPLAAELKGRPYQRQTAIVYEDLLGRLPEILDHPDRYQTLWQDEDAKLQATEDAIQHGTITIEERPDIDLAVVTASDTAPWPHDAAINNRTRRMRVLTMQGHRYVLRYRYETWVVYVSEPVMPRVDLHSLAKALNDEDHGDWRAGSIDDITPALKRTGESAIAPEHFRVRVEEYLK